MAEKGIITPLFLERAKRQIFAVYHAPAPGRQPRGSVIYIPPFAEEMNLSRRMAALQARMLAAAGTEVLLLDLFGTGDSGGDFRDARWALWIEDVLAAADWLQDRKPGPIGLWGLRMGGLLAVAVAAGRRDRFKRLLLWQPITEGKRMLTQFLRIRAAASMRETAAGETTDRLRAELAEQQSIEVAGYELPIELVIALDDVRMDSLELDPGTHVAWFDVSSAASNRPGRMADRIAEVWRRKGVTVSMMSVAGEQFWSVPEASMATELLSATARSVDAWLAQ